MGAVRTSPFPNTAVTAVNVIARGSRTFNSSVDAPGLDGQGPVSWSVNTLEDGMLFATSAGGGGDAKREFARRHAGDRVPKHPDGPTALEEREPARAGAAQATAKVRKTASATRMPSLDALSMPSASLETSSSAAFHSVAPWWALGFPPTMIAS